MCIRTRATLAKRLTLVLMSTATSEDARATAKVRFSSLFVFFFLM